MQHQGAARLIFTILKVVAPCEKMGCGAESSAGATLRIRPPRRANRSCTMALRTARFRRTYVRTTSRTTQNDLRRKTHFTSRLNHITPVQPFPRKYSSFALSEIMFLYPRPASLEGRFAIVTNVEAGCGGRVDVAARVSSRRRTAAMRTVKSRGPDTPTLVLSLSWRSRVAQVTVANKPGAPGRSRSSR